MIVANGRYYGGRFVCAPKARLDSAVFQACLFGRAGRSHVVRYALALLIGRLHRLADVTIVPAGGPRWQSRGRLATDTLRLVVAR